MKKIYILILSTAILTGCLGSKAVEASPETTLVNFYAAVFSGDFNKAESLCSTLNMREYLNGIRTTYEKTDSTIMTIIPAILSETKVSINEVIKNGQERLIYYELTAQDGSYKEKTATLRKEEGAWKVSAITDRP